MKSRIICEVASSRVDVEVEVEECCERKVENGSRIGGECCKGSKVEEAKRGFNLKRGASLSQKIHTSLTQVVEDENFSVRVQGRSIYYEPFLTCLRLSILLPPIDDF